jgi:photosystem II stability/assembly factor-like uncharacterized protein
MRNRRSLASIVAVALLTPLAARAAPARWTLASQSTFTHFAYVAAFQDEQNGVTGGMGGLMFYTRDGGKTWTQGQNQSNCRWNLDARPGSAFSVGNRGDVRFSADDGATWTAVAQFNAARSISFLDAKRGFVSDEFTLGLTGDGGRSWTKLDRPRKAGSVAAVSLAERGQALELRFVDEAGAIWLSTDGGAKWARSVSPLKHPVVSTADGPRAAMRFHGAEGVLAAVLDEEAGERAHVFRTRDGGRTWEEEVVPDLPPGAPNLSWDGKLLVMFTMLDRTVRVYRAE